MKTLWKFTRPHTVIGSFLSVSVLFILSGNSSLSTYCLVLLSALFCNVYITGLNQIYDIEIDKINKPKLPIASGEWSVSIGKRVVYANLILCLLVLLILSWIWGVDGVYYAALLVSISLLGTAYSVPPIRFKRFHIWAATAIALVRGPLVNLGIGWFFIETSQSSVFEYELYHWLLPLTVFITLFSVGIAWFKDLPDTEGDQEFGIQTLAVKQSKKTAFVMGFLLVFGGFLFVLVYMSNKMDVGEGKNSLDLLNDWNSFYLSQVLGIIVFSVAAIRVKLNSNDSLKTFYKIYWVLFFLMYLSYLFLK